MYYAMRTTTTEEGLSTKIGLQIIHHYLPIENHLADNIPTAPKKKGEEKYAHFSSLFFCEKLNFISFSDRFLTSAVAFTLFEVII